ncbi:MAG: sugar phosphate isomerase/epimerase [Acidobacteriales bacterium]|nr:sugar phosphate isomerase/epimerase [Terriglobales bacterium]
MTQRNPNADTAASPGDSRRESQGNSLDWRKAIVIRAFAQSPDFLGSTVFLHSLEDYRAVFRRARSLGFQGVQLYLEISGGVLNLSTPGAALEELAALARAEGVQFPSLEIAPLQYSFTSDDPSERRRGKEVVARAMEIARGLGCSGVLVIPGYVGKMWDPGTDQVSYDHAYDRTLEALRELAPAAERLRVPMLVEPIWNMFLLSPLEMRRLVDEVGSPWCGVLLDTGNVTLCGFAEQWIRILGSRVREIHMKDFRRQVGTINGFAPLLAGDVNWPAVTAAARVVGFSGFWTAEQFPYPHHGQTILEHTSLAMDRILGCVASSHKQTQEV